MKTLSLEFLTDAQIRRTLVECFASRHPHATQVEMGKLIQEFTRQQYKILGFESSLRKPGMSDVQRKKLRQHEIATIRMLLAN